MMFCLFMFLCLALIKRLSELIDLRNRGAAHSGGRGYVLDDLSMLRTSAAAAAYAAVLVIALYISSQDVARLYRMPDLLWFLCPVILYWLNRMLLIANRGHMHVDPVVLALTDRTGMITGGIAAAIVVAAAAV